MKIGHGFAKMSTDHAATAAKPALSEAEGAVEVERSEARAVQILMKDNNPVEGVQV